MARLEVIGNGGGPIAEIYGVDATTMSGWAAEEPGNTNGMGIGQVDATPVYVVFFRGDFHHYGPPYLGGGTPIRSYVEFSAGRIVFSESNSALSLEYWSEALPLEQDATPGFGPAFDDG